jgi:hypothetical protein
MDDRLEILAGGGIAEYLGGERGPVDGAVRAQNLGAEAFHHGGVAVGAGLDDRPGQPVGVDHDRAQLRQPGRHRALAGPDASGQPHEQHARQGTGSGFWPAAA